ncbi:MAG: DUF1840 family protein [Burkholderiales bacterium]|nr:MAG: DUF1840 family protein [Burkholderiales bacterium]
MVKFKSQATGDLLMIQVHARALLSQIGKSDDKGIIEVADMPKVLLALKGLPDELASDESSGIAGLGDFDAEGVQIEAQPAFADEPISLRKRAVPLIKMIERAMAANKPIVWGV